MLGIRIENLRDVLQWKERAIILKPRWTNLTFLAVMGVITLQMTYLFFAVRFSIPKTQRSRNQGSLHFFGSDRASEMMTFLDGVQWTCDRLGIWLLLLLVLLWVSFEYTVRSVNKTFIRLATFGSLALALMSVVAYTAISIECAIPSTGPMFETVGARMAGQQALAIDAYLNALEQAVKDGDWNAALANRKRVSKALNSIGLLEQLSPERLKLADFRTRLQSATANLHEVWRSLLREDEDLLKIELRKFKEEYDPIREWAMGVEK